MNDQQPEHEGAMHQQQSEGMHSQLPKLQGGNSAHQSHPQNDGHDRQPDPEGAMHGQQMQMAEGAHVMIHDAM